MSKPLPKDLWIIFKNLRDVSVVMYNEFSDVADKEQLKWLLEEVRPTITEAERILMPNRKFK
jgi:hypothetical protein